MTSGTDWVIRGARPLGGEPADITITDGTITAIGDAAGEQGAQALDAAGLIALPGLVDLHTHLREPGPAARSARRPRRCRRPGRCWPSRAPR